MTTKDAAPMLAPIVNESPVTVDAKACTATYTVSSIAVDNDGDILVPAGSLPHIERFAANPVVLWNHQRDMLPVAQSINPVTKQLSWSVEPGRVQATAYFHCLTMESSQCWALIEAGVLRGASVGFNAIQGKTERSPGGGTKFLEWEPLEWSVCPIPNNPETLLEAVHKKWDGRQLHAGIVKSLMPYLPEQTKTVVPVRSYVKLAMPWKVK